MPETHVVRESALPLFHALGRIRVRLLVVNLLVLLVPIVGLEFARLHERQLLEALQRDMMNQARLVRATIETDALHGVALGDPRHAEALTLAAKDTRTRVRLLDASANVVADSHANGPPEGPEPPPPKMLPRSIEDSRDRRAYEVKHPWPLVPDRLEVKTALAGAPGAFTRIRDKSPGVLLFVTEPIRDAEKVIGVVYVVRSTAPVIVELYRIRSGLFRVLAVAIVLTALLTIALAWSISRPLERLSRAARRVADGQREVVIPVGGGGEIGELAASFAQMKERLDARLRYISDFAADVAHEFKSPLTSIGGAAELLDEGAADDPDARARFLRNIRLDVARLDRLVSRLLELSRIEASSAAWSLVDLRSLTTSIVERAATEARPVELVWSMQSEYVEARAADLESAIANLVENAVRFSPDGAPVIVEVAGGPVRADGYVRRSGTCRITVRDRGAGIPEANLPKIFDRFFTTDAGRDGTGLGLAIVKSVAEAHGGKVVAENAADGGAIFTLSIPLRQR